MLTTLHPTAGYVPDISNNSQPGLITLWERKHLRALASRVAEIAANPHQKEKKNLWYRHNNLQKIPPMVLVFPEDSWIEIIGEDQLKVKDPYWRQWE